MFLYRNQKNTKKLTKKNKIDLISLEKMCFSYAESIRKLLSSKKNVI